MDDERQEGRCRFTAGVSCYVECKPCWKCGWNPKVSKRRLKKIKEERQRALKEGLPMQELH